MSFLLQDLSQRLNYLRDDHARTNAALEARLKAQEDALAELRRRLSVLTRLLISRQIATAEEIAAAFAAPAVIAPPSPDSGAMPPDESSPQPTESPADAAGSESP